MGGWVTKVRQDVEYLYEKLTDVRGKSTRENSVIEVPWRMLSDLMLNIEEERNKPGCEKKEEEKKKNREKMWRMESSGGKEMLVAYFHHPKGDVRADSMSAVERMGLCVMMGGHIHVTFVNEWNWKKKGDTITKISGTLESCTVDEEFNEV
jgi:hypothetical protein